MSSSQHRQKIVVLGAGVVGLTAALRLHERFGGRVAIEIVAERVAERTLSRVAAASFYPFAVSHPSVGEWLHYGRKRFQELVGVREPVPSGVIEREGFEIEPRPIAGRSPTEYLLPSQRASRSRGERVERFRLFIIEMPIYLPYLKARVAAAGIPIRVARIASLDELGDGIIVNCTGWAAGRLVRDPELKPTYGQLVRVEADDVEVFALDERDAAAPTYVVPRSRDVVVGSIDRPFDPVATGFEPPPPDPIVTHQILERGTLLDPKLERARVLESYCGIRPRRSSVRVEIDRELSNSRRVIIHDYGHGGGGVTLSWGCAEEVANRIEPLLSA